MLSKLQGQRTGWVFLILMETKNNVNNNVNFIQGKFEIGVEL